MRRPVLAILSLALLAIVASSAAGCGGAPVQGSGRPTWVAVPPAGDFRAIRADGAFELTVGTGIENLVRVDADDNLVPLLRAKVEDGALWISTDGSWSSSNPFRVTVTVKALDGVRVGGAVKASVDALRGDTVTITAEGASSVEVAAVAGKAVHAVSLGTAKITFAGSAAESLDAKATNFSSITARIACATAKLLAQGASSVTGVTAKRATAFVAGASSIDLDCTEHLQADAGGTSKIRYGGEPKVEGTVGKTASVEKRGIR